MAEDITYFLKEVLKFFGNVFPYFQANELKRFFASFRSDKRLKKFRSYFLSSVFYNDVLHQVS